MGNLAQHIAKIARRKHPARMGVLATSLARDAATAIESRDALSAERLTQDDDEVETLRRKTFRNLFSEDWSHRGGTDGRCRADRPLRRALRRSRGGDRTPGQRVAGEVWMRLMDSVMDKIHLR
jgi:phosphate uptake regulator